jgi:exopolyphosphatase / guanosine-5'-triphosphate,3'-diphosphate pyrophosphatase
MPKAVIDIGSNSIKLAIGEPEKNGVRIVEFLKKIVPLGESAFCRNTISRDAINQTIHIIKRYKRVLKEYNVSAVKMVATTAIREANNKDIFVDLLRHKTGLETEVLAVGDVLFFIESYLDFKIKNLFPLHTENLVTAEMGTGSLDVSVREKGLSCFHRGLPIGTMRLKQLVSTLGGSAEENHLAVAEYIANEFKNLKKNIRPVPIDDIIIIDENYAPYLENIIASGRSESNFQRLSAGEVNRLLRRLKGKRAEDIAEQYNIPLGLADTFTAYAIILKNFCALLKKRHVHVLEIALSKAILADMIFQTTVRGPYDWHGQLIHEARFLCKKYDLDQVHSEHVAYLSQKLFEGLKDYLGLSDKEKTYVEVAAHLHDLGMSLNNRAHHKHSEYGIQHLNLIRLSEEEKKIIACVARYHRKNSPRKSHPLYSSLPNAAALTVKKLSALLRIANALDASHKQKVKDLTVRMDRDYAFTLVVRATESMVLEKADLNNKKKYFEELTGTHLRLVVTV